MDAIYLFAKNFIGVEYEDLPREVIEVTKKEVLDLLGVSLAGFTAPGVQELLELVRDWGVKGRAALFVASKKCLRPWQRR